MDRGGAPIRSGFPREQKLNASPTAQNRLLDLQDVDLRTDQLQHRRRNLPEHAEAADLEARLVALRDQLVEARTEEGDIAREQTKIENDVEAVRERSRRDQERLNSASVSARELTNLQHEIESLAKRQSDLEDVVLEIMERREAAQGRIEELVAEQHRLEADRGTVAHRLETETGTIDTAVAQLAATREKVLPDIPADLLALYEKLRAQHGGRGAAPLRQRRCEGCRLEIDLIELNAIRSAPADEVVRCESCRRILVRTADSGL